MLQMWKDKHKALECYFKEAICHNCGKKGHVARACRSRSKAPLGPPQGHESASNSKKQARKTHHTQQEEDDSEYTQYALFTISKMKTSVTVSPNGLEIEMEVDTRASLSVISKTTYLNLWPA